MDKSHRKSQFSMTGPPDLETGFDSTPQAVSVDEIPRDSVD